MHKNIEFLFPKGERHTKSHYACVFLLSLLIGHQKSLSDEEKDVAIFHDSYRLDEGINRGH